jgi:glucokinase
MSEPPRQFIRLADAQPPFFVGIDLGGTNIKIGVVDDLGRSLAWLNIPTEVEKGPENAAARMAKAALESIRRAGLEKSQVARIGLGSPGTMDIPAGRLLNPVNLKGWDDFPLRDRLSFHSGLPVSFENDANAAAYGEYWVGAGREHRSLVLFTLGTGIGSGIIVEDRLIDGANSHGGECGHIIVDSADNARLCGCNQRGHLEAYASATAVVKRTEELLAAGRQTTLRDRLKEGKELTPLLLAEEANAGDPLALEIILETARWIGIGIVSVMHTIDPEIVLLGGAMTFGGKEAELGRRFLARIREEVKRRAFPLLAERTVIDFASLGGDAGYIGAAGVARLEYKMAIAPPCDPHL